MNTISIYALINPLNEQVFYVGASERPKERLYVHRTSFTNQCADKVQEIKAIRQFGYDVEMIILDTCYRDEVRFWEEFYIDLFFSYGFKLKQGRKSNYYVPTYNISFINKDGYDIYTLYADFRDEEINITLKQSELSISNTKIRDKLKLIYENKIGYIKAKCDQISV